MTPISVAELCARFDGSDEFALIDPREEGIFTRAHLLGASNLPLSRLELLIGKTVPRLDTEIVLTDDGDNVAVRTASVLSGLGYTNIRQLAGGLAAWSVAGFHLFSGVNIIGKAFGEYLEHTAGTPSIRPEDLKDRLERGENVFLLDSRTPAEHANFCIPGALSCPNGEMVYRALPAIPEGAAVVVHCAGRTRSILGAQTLIEAGAAGEVVALENGTIDWEFAGLDLEHGASRPLDKPEAAPLPTARALADAQGVEEITADRLLSWRTESDRTLCLLDVRGKEEFAAGHLAGARHAPGGQLVQNVDRYLVVRNALTVLVDDDGVRARASAYWLSRMGYRNVFTLTASGTNKPPRAAAGLPQSVSVDDVVGNPEWVVADVRTSVSYRRGHVPGAWFLTRAYLARDEGNLPAGSIVLVGADAGYVALIAADLQALGREVFCLEGGMNAWCAAEKPVETGLTALASAPDDMHVNGGDLDDPAQAAREYRRYLDWEIGLIDMMPGDPAATWYSAA
ncbi:MAG: rhodanese-like domain-containing protein [Pseudomonadota bacterium]